MSLTKYQHWNVSLPVWGEPPWPPSCPPGCGLPGRVSSRYQSRSGPVLQPGQDGVPSKHVPHSWWNQGCSDEGKLSGFLFIASAEPGLQKRPSLDWWKAVPVSSRLTTWRKVLWQVWPSNTCWRTVSQRLRALVLQAATSPELDWSSQMDARRTTSQSLPSSQRKLVSWSTSGKCYTHTLNPVADSRCVCTGIIMYAVGVGKAVEDELREIASEPVEKHFYYSADFTAISTIAENLKLNVCPGMTQRRFQSVMLIITLFVFIYYFT